MITNEPPKPNNNPSIHNLISDELDPNDPLLPWIEARKQKGLETYGTTLQAFNGRNSLIDALEEVLDSIAYLKQAIEENSSCELAHDLYYNQITQARKLVMLIESKEYQEREKTKQQI